MIAEFDNIKISRKNGNKANSLVALRKAGFPVPDGFVLNSDVFDGFFAANNLSQALRREFSKNDLTELGSETLKMISGSSLDKKTLSIIDKLTSSEKKYAVRSSCTKEDLEGLSFAGQYETFLYVDKKDIPGKIIECYKATFNRNIIAYCAKNGIDLKTLKMAVIVQEMVDPDYSGICFTINPMTGNDKGMLIEVGEGVGEGLVSGRKTPKQYRYDWYSEKVLGPKSKTPLDAAMIEKIGKCFSNIQAHFGYPCDIEFAIQNDNLYVLQARRITKITYSGYDDVWTTADFKDGGVSATVCTPFMWSLYEYIWNATLRKFILDSKILKPKHFEGRKLGDMFFGRCYWNLSIVKQTMSQVVGYREREFDNEYGIKGDYSGDGQVTKFSPKSIVHLVQMAVAQRRIVMERESNAKRLKQELLRKYTDYLDNFEKNKPNIEGVWLRLTKDDYFFSESTYFWQIFINTIHQSLYKDSLLKHLSEDEYLAVLGGIEDISHLRPFYGMWDISRMIRKNKSDRDFWEQTEARQILRQLAKSKSKVARAVKELIHKYGYHSDKELDVTYECYFENPLPCIENIKQMVSLGDEYGPEHDQKRNREKYLAIMNRVKHNVGEKKFKKIEAKINKMREMLWWREEFRDTSTRFYYIVRLYSLELGEALAYKGVLLKPMDIWMLKIGDLWDYYEGKTSPEGLQETVERNRRYYDSFRNYTSDNEIVPNHSTIVASDKKDIVGLGACSGTVTATARIIKDFSEIDRLQKGDILVTKFTDTGWTPKFATIAGIVTEYGGILCHAAIVSREYDIPAVVNCHDALKRIQDGQRITIDGSTGVVTLEEQE